MGGGGRDTLVWCTWHRLSFREVCSLNLAVISKNHYYMFNLFQLAVIVLCVSETLSARVKGRRKRKIGGSGNSEPGIDFTDCINDPETGKKMRIM